MTERDFGDEPLLQLATPDLYRRNAFRVLNVPVTMASRDLQRELNRRRMEARLGVAAANGKHGPLALPTAPTEDETRTATSRLGRPVDRLLDEVFWFWSTGAADPALDAISDGDTEAARNIWLRLEAESDQIAIHNLAVLDHLLALDRELADGAAPEPPTGAPGASWQGALARWHTVHKNESFWSALRDRVRILDDAQLPTGIVRQIRSSLPAALLLINAKLALASAERGDAARARQHLSLLRNAGFGKEAAEEAIRESLQPLRNRLRTMTETARAAWTRTPQHGDTHVRELHAQSANLVATLDALLPVDDITRVSVRDTLADAMLEGAAIYGNKTNNWTESRLLLVLIQTVAAGEQLKDRIEKNIDTVTENIKSGNDWCTPAYWSLPADTIAQLEEARALVGTGDLDGAIRLLLGMPPTIGEPLRRCVAFSLNGRGWQILNDAFDKFNDSPSPQLKKFLEVINRQGTVQVPDPHTPVWQNPPCPCCGRTGYTRWFNGEHKGQRFWMCDSCSAKDDAEREANKRELRNAISQALEYVLLAAEVDPVDVGIRESERNARKIAADVSVTIPSTHALKKRLAAASVSAGPRTVSLPGVSVCYFCGQNDADPGSAITVPMYGDVGPTDLLLQKGVAFSVSRVVVPRCRRCRDEHVQLPGQLKKWHDARRAAAADVQPELIEQVEAAQSVADEATARVSAQQQEVSALMAALSADTNSTACPKCAARTPGVWSDGLCRDCDRSVFALDALSWIGIVLTAYVAFVLTFIVQRNLGLLAPPDLVVPGASAAAGLLRLRVLIGFLAGAATAAGLKWLQRRQQRVLRERRLAEFERRRVNADDAKNRVAAAQAALATAEKAAAGPKLVLARATQALNSAREMVVAEFELNVPEPSLSSGVKPESDYTSFAQITELRSRGWGFGDAPQSDWRAVRIEPVGVTGLVTRDVKLGEVVPVNMRARLLALAKRASPDSLIRCPICNSEMRARHAADHYHRKHR